MIMSKGKSAVLVYGRFPEFFEDGVRPLDIPECNPNHEGNWMGDTKKELEKQEFEVYCPVVPEVWKAPYSAWKDEFNKFDINEETTMVGLSQGAGAITRYLAEKKKSIKKLILVAPARNFPDKEWAEFYNYEIDEGVKKRIEKGTTVFYDSKDYEVVVNSVAIYKKELDAKVIEFPGWGHFSFEKPKLPELFEEITKAY